MADDTGTYFVRLAEILVKYGFDWVVTRAEVEIAEGRAITKEVRALEYGELIEADSFATRAPRRRRTSLMTTEPFSDDERLVILLRGIDAALSTRADLERSILYTLNDISVVEFVPEEGVLGPALVDARRRRHRLDRDRLEEGSRIKRRLDEAVRQLREETDVGS